VQDTNNQYGTKIQILNELSHSDCLVAIIKSKALIYVSLSESYGLPLVEASALNIPILASRLDYVKDVCNPQLVFDPLSAISIANSVKKFLAAPKFVRGKINDRLKDLCRAITN
jgi:glycosyltransferase involved in cell wall biosynthesis